MPIPTMPMQPIPTMPMPIPTIPTIQPTTASTMSGQLYFHHLSGSDVPFNCSKHRVLFWAWHKDRSDHLAFVDLEEWSRAPCFWKEHLNSTRIQFPDGSPVPFSIIKRFLGIPNYLDHNADFSRCVPGLDSLIFKGVHDCDWEQTIRDWGKYPTRYLRHKFIIVSPETVGASGRVQFILQRIEGVNVLESGWTNPKPVVNSFKDDEDTSSEGPAYRKYFGAPTTYRRKPIPGAMAEDSLSFSSVSSPESLEIIDFDASSNQSDEISFHHLNGNVQTYDPRLHRVLFWTWFEGRPGHLAFLTLEEWHDIKDFQYVWNKNMVVFWVEQLSKFTLDHPEGSPVPLTVMKRFLGLCGDPLDSLDVIEETYPGVDSILFKDNQDPFFVSEMVKKSDCTTKKFQFKLLPSPSKFMRFSLCRQAKDGTLVHYAWTPIVEPPLPQLQLQSKSQSHEDVSGKERVFSGRLKRRRSTDETSRILGSVDLSSIYTNPNPTASDIWKLGKHGSQENGNSQNGKEIAAKSRIQMDPFVMHAVEKARGDALLAELDRVKRVLLKGGRDIDRREVEMIDGAIAAADSLKRALMLSR